MTTFLCIEYGTPSQKAQGKCGMLHTTLILINFILTFYHFLVGIDSSVSSFSTHSIRDRALDVIGHTEPLHLWEIPSTEELSPRRERPTESEVCSVA